MRTKPTAVFMAFGTKGDVYPVAAIAAAFASDQPEYEIAFVTHSAHQLLAGHLGVNRVVYYPVSSPPVLSFSQERDTSGSSEGSLSWQKKEITTRHRQECVSIFERIYGEYPVMDGDLVIINFFALEGWSLAELFHVRCIVTAPYVVPYSAPSAFERVFRKELPILYHYLRQAPADKIGWEDVLHWMWPLFGEDWGTWRSLNLQLSLLPFTDPVTGLPTWHDRLSAPLLLYGFSNEVVEFPDYWPSRVRICGFWFAPIGWQFSCSKCRDISSLISLRNSNDEDEICPIHAQLKDFLHSSAELPIFISLSSIGSMGYVKNPKAFLRVLENVLNTTSCRFLLFSAGYEPLDAAIRELGQISSSSTGLQSSEEQISIFDNRLFCFSGSVPYSWLFPKCAAAIHHGGSGATAAALHAGIPQVVCPFILDQFYWAERMFWLGVAPEPLKSNYLLPDKDDTISIMEAANVVAGAIKYALSPQVKSRASQFARKISTEDGVSKAVQIIKEEMKIVSTS